MKRTLLVALVLVSLIFGIVAYASAASEQITVKIQVNPLLTLTVDPIGGNHVLTWTNMNVNDSASEAVAVSVASNRIGTLDAEWVGDDPALLDYDLTSYLEGAGTQSFLRGDGSIASNHWDELIEFTVDYNTPALDSGSKDFVLEYTALQTP